MVQEEIFSKQEEIQKDFHDKMKAMKIQNDTLSYGDMYSAIVYEYLAKISLEIDELKQKTRFMNTIPIKSSETNII